MLALAAVRGQRTNCCQPEPRVLTVLAINDIGPACRSNHNHDARF